MQYSVSSTFPSLIMALAALALAPPLLAQHQEGGFFSEEQVARGSEVYGKQCAACHGAELRQGTAPALVGPDFSRRWEHPLVTADDLFHVVRSSMPPGAPGSLSDQEYTDVLAFVLGANGYETGEEELASDAASLRAVPLDLGDLAPVARREAPEFIRGDARPSGGPTQAELNAAAQRTDAWLYNTRSYDGSRYAPIDEINTENVAKLQVACLFQVGVISNFQSGPIVYDGTMYLTTADTTHAIDARTCEPKWRHEWRPYDRRVWSSNRGVALEGGYVVRGTTDGYLVALDAASGELAWARHVASPTQGETFTMAPLIFEDLVLIGPAGSENKISGWVGAFRLEDGAPVWRFNTVPKPGEPGSETWRNSEEVPVGGGAVWTPFSLDAERGELYVAVTNPAPDLPAYLRPGANLYTNSLVALDVRTGALRWYRQLVPNDSHDYDLTQVSPLLDLPAQHGGRRVVITAGKDGFLRGIDRSSHDVLYETAVTTIENVDEPVTTQGVHVCPGPLGGVEWSGPAYNPSTNLLYVPAVDWCAFFKVNEDLHHMPGRLYMGGSARRDPDRNMGWLTAIDAASGEVAWKVQSDRPLVANVTTTAGGLVMTGDLNGYFLVFDAKSGKELYRFNTGGAIGGGVVTYEVAGRQYIAVASGRPSRFWVDENPGAPTLLVFALPDGH